MRNRIPAARLRQLRTIPLFAGCGDTALAAGDRLVDDHDVPAGTVLTREGAFGRESFVIVSGTAEVTVRGQRVAELGSGAVFGEMAVLQREPRTATVTALTPMHLLVVSPANLSALLLTEGVAGKVLVALSERLRAADDAITAQSAVLRPGARRRTPLGVS